MAAHARESEGVERERSARWRRQVARDEAFPAVAIRCAWCHGWMSAPTWPDRLPVSHGLCPACRDHLCHDAAAS